jgi:trans-aconitate methyltransferase
MHTIDRKQHWDMTWSGKSHRETSWYQAVPTPSLEMIDHARADPAAPVIDVGGGASPLAGCLLAAGFADVTVLDISTAALEQAKEGLSEDARRVHWVEADVTRFVPDRTYALWHDRAVFHFLTDPEDRRRYANVLHAALRPGGQAIVATFAPGGPTKCSGLDIVQYSAGELADELGDDMELCEERVEYHATPAGKEQKFGFYRFRRRTRAA